MPYFRRKAELESTLRALGVSYCILRPTVLFGKEDVLIPTKLTEWMDRQREKLGRRYTSELARRMERVSEYRAN